MRNFLDLETCCEIFFLLPKIGFDTIENEPRYVFLYVEGSRALVWNRSCPRCPTRLATSRLGPARLAKIALRLPFANKNVGIASPSARNLSTCSQSLISRCEATTGSRMYIWSHILDTFSSPPRVPRETHRSCTAGSRLFNSEQAMRCGLCFSFFNQMEHSNDPLSKTDFTKCPADIF